MTLVKICGVTNLNDALLAARFGADQLGFNFYPNSPRYIDPASVREIVRQLPAGIRKIGVFVNEEIDMICEISQAADLDGIQLHGSESPEFTSNVKKRLGSEVIKAFRVSKGFEVDDVLRYQVDAVLLDAYSQNEYGGTGEVFDWDIAAAVNRAVPRLYLAGGLSEFNVAKAIGAVMPYCVDACSCIESEPGIKDELKLWNFLRSAGKEI